MVELEKDQWNFILYDDDGVLILNVLCGSVGLFELNYILDMNEIENYKTRGVDYIRELARRVNHNPKNVPSYKLRPS